MMRTIENTVKYIRSKNAGPFWLTIDAFCNSVEDTENVAAAFEREQSGACTSIFPPYSVR